MLVKHGNDMYSWGENKVHTGAKAKTRALIDGISESGIVQFRISARQSGVGTYQIEMAIAEFRAKSQNITRDDTRTGDDDLDYPDNNSSDINGTVA